MSSSGGTYMRAEPALVKDLVWAGFDLVSRANNHTGDYGVLGMNLTTKYVAEAGLVQAGVGQSLAEAREAKFLETPKGRVALISVASTFTDHSVRRTHARRHAGSPRTESAAVRHHHDRDPAAARTTLREMAAEINGRPAADRRTADVAELLRPPLHRRGDARACSTVPNKEDVDEIGAVVEAPPASPTTPSSPSTPTRADAIACSRPISSSPSRAPWWTRAPTCSSATDRTCCAASRSTRASRFSTAWATSSFRTKRCSGCRARTTSRTIWRPDKHVNDFNDARYNFDKSGFPADRMIWEAVVAVPKFRGEQLTELALHPITLGFGQSRSVRGRPLFAEGELGQKILGDITKLSQRWARRSRFATTASGLSLGR